MLRAPRRVIEAVKILARDGRIPKPLRGLVAFGVLPIPGPVDEVVLLIVGPISLGVLSRPVPRGMEPSRRRGSRRRVV